MSLCGAAQRRLSFQRQVVMLSFCVMEEYYGIGRSFDFLIVFSTTTAGLIHV
jgi:hypothetical protein